MSQSHDAEREDRAILRALELLDQGQTVSSEEPDGDLVASYLETWTALPEALPRTETRPELKDQILQHVATHGHPREPSSPPAAKTLPFLPASTPTRSLGLGWYQALAASLVLGVIGLGAFSYNLSQELDRQGGELAALEQTLTLGHKEAELSQANYTFPELGNRFAQVSVPKSQLFSLNAEKPSSAPIHGAMLVCAKHRQWLLKVNGLTTPTPGEEYHLWFVTSEGPVHVGRLLLDSTQGAEVGAAHMPEHTVGLVISQEEAAPVGARPQGPILARARQPAEI